MLLLLDIDGVMVPAKSWQRPDFLKDGFPDFSHEAVSALNLLLDSTAATVVLTTSHKHSYTIAEWLTLFENRGIILQVLDRLPENNNNLNRKEEILQWYATSNPNEAFLIIDDDKSLHGLPPHLKSKLLHTDTSIGLTKALVMEVLGRLDEGEM